MSSEIDSLFENAVVVEAGDTMAGIQAERDYIARICGEPRRAWKLQQQSLLHHNGKPYDRIIVSLSNGETRTFYFDVSKFFGK